MYKIVRSYLHHPPRTIKRGLTLEEVQAHCRNLETGSYTCTNSRGKALTKKRGHWFDGFDKE